MKAAYVIEPWSQHCDSSCFTSDLASITKYIQEQAHRDVSSRNSAVFVLLENGKKIVRGYYSLSAISIVFDKLPREIQRKLPRYPEASGILLGRLGVDKQFSINREQELGEKPRLGELLLADAQIRCLMTTKHVGSALMVVDAEMPTTQELAAGARDPLPFYEKYGFKCSADNSRRVVKTLRSIEKELAQASSRG